jgi:hypothetical protein
MRKKWQCWHVIKSVPFILVEREMTKISVLINTIKYILISIDQASLVEKLFEQRGSNFHQMLSRAHNTEGLTSRLFSPIQIWKFKFMFSWLFRYMMIEFEVYNFHIYGKGVPFRSLLETLVLYKVGPQVMLLSFSFACYILCLCLWG